LVLSYCGLLTVSFLLAMFKELGMYGGFIVFRPYRGGSDAKPPKAFFYCLEANRRR
jgi:hypothetical protein